MKNFRIYYMTVGVTSKTPPCANIKAANADEAVEIFKTRRPWSEIVAIFA